MWIRILLGVVVSSVVVVLFSKLARTRPGSLGAIFLSAIGFFFSGLLFFGLVMQMAATFLASAICLVFNPPKAVVWGLMLAAMGFGYAIALATIVPELNRLASLRQEFPLESLADRLEYEQAAAVVQNVSLRPLSDEVERQLTQFEERDRDQWNRRQGSLRSLHERYRDDFILATGFGPGRMIGIYRDWVEVKDLGPVPLTNRAVRELDSAASDPAIVQGALADSLPGRATLAGLHDAGCRDLLDPTRFGYVKDKQHVAGFESHRFTRLPKPADDPTLRWTLVRLELIGLLKYDRPKAYVSEHLPRLDELGEAATREVDDFEREGLEQLQADEDLVIDQAPQRIRMLGSLRAGKDCLECHSVQRGQLLGALSYEIVPRDRQGIVAAAE